MTHKSSAKAIVIGTRNSALARRQTDLILARLRSALPGQAFEIKAVETEGDKVQDRPIQAIGDKGVFVRAIELALLRGDIDLAVHSLKDMPTDEIEPALALIAYSPREDPRDVLVSRHGRLFELPRGARVGTGSLRRRAQLFDLRPDVQTLDIRGNVDTRLRKLGAGDYDAIILAAAGLHRLGWQDRITEYLPIERFVPDAGQGIMAVQARADSEVAALVRVTDDVDSHVAADAERAVVRALDAGCHSPVGAYLKVAGPTVTLRAMAATEDGRQVFRRDASGRRDEAAALGWRLGAALAQIVPKSATILDDD